MAIRAEHPQNLTEVALSLWRVAGRATPLFSADRSGERAIAVPVNVSLSNTISIQVMEKAASLDVQYYEDDVCYDKLQRASTESAYRPYQIFSQISALGSQLVTLVSVVAVLLSWNWWPGLLILLAPLPGGGTLLF